jgi:hypothetical protein
MLEVRPDLARLGISDPDWLDPEIAGAVLLAVAQCWRFWALERALDQLTAQAAEDVYRLGQTGIGVRWRRGRRIRHADRALRALMLDLPAFEAPLTDPRGQFATTRGVRLFRRLTRGLSLHSWRERIDERIETLEAVFAAEVEAIRHGELFTCEVVLEALILAVLLADITFHAFAAWFWE